MVDLPDFALPPEPRKSNSEGKRLPSEQESAVPLGWKATLAKPLPAVRCTGTVRSGERQGEQCDKWSLAGATVCFQHGGQLPSVQKAAEERKQAARLLLVDSTGEAVETIAWLMKFAVQENVKLAAAKDILDRAGIKGGADITVDHQHTLAPSKMLGDKLEEMAKRVLKEREEQFTADPELDIIKSEVVQEDETDNLTNE